MPTALITGGTSGIGAAFARRLARDGQHLVLVARDADRLKATADDLHGRYGVRVDVLVADLTVTDDCAAVERRLADPDRPVDWLVNCAGFSLRRPFMANDIEDEQRMLDVHVRAPMRLTHAVLPGMIARDRGIVINVASVAGFTPRGTYSAAKAWMINFSEGLAFRLRGTGVHVMALCPGFVHTGVHARMSLDMSRVPGWMWLDADDVVDAALSDARRRRPVSVPSARYKVLAALARHTPHSILTRFSGIGGRR
jgi:short-subunit dehydrogenase